MAWLGRFDDFEEDWGGNIFQQSSSKPSGELNRQIQQKQGQGNQTEVKRLCDITTNSTDVTVVGVIIAKEQQRSIFSKKNVGGERHLVSFTLRDSPSYFVNVTCWGNADFISDISCNFQVGSLNVSENHSSVEPYTGWNAATYRNTLSIPTRPNNDYYTIEDIGISGMTLQGEHVNILAAVKKVGPIRYLTTKTRKQTKKCDVVLFDDTTQAFCLDLWQNHADAALLWTPFETVLFIADVKITYNSFKSSMVGTADSKTIFTVDPDTPEAHCLRQFLRTQDSTAMDMDYGLTCNDVDPDLSSITEVFTVKQLKEKRSSMMQDMTTLTHCGILYGMLTGFNLDTDTADVVRKLCGDCRKRVSLADFATCTNPECSTDYSSNKPAGTLSTIVTEYNIPVSLSDHTGTINFCHLQSAVADTVVSCQPQEFLGMPEELRTNVKWQYLLEHCKVLFKLKMFKPGMDQLPSVQILSLEKQTYVQKRLAQRSGQIHGQF